MEDADAEVLSELLATLPAANGDQTEPRASAELLDLSWASELPDCDGKESEMLCNDAGLLDALCAPLMAFDDGFLVNEIDTRGFNGQDESGDAVPAVEEAVGRRLDSPGRLIEDPTTSKSAPRRTNSNRARDEKRRELMSLRSQVTAMEEQIEGMKVAACRPPTLRDLENRMDKLAHVRLKGPSTEDKQEEQHVELVDVWRQMCLQQLSRRIRAERENARLKDAVARRAQVTTGIKALLQIPLGPNDAELLPRKRLRSPNIPPTDPDIERRIFAQLSSGIDGAFRKIDAFLEEKGLVNVDTPRHGTNLREVEGRTVLELFVTTVLPCKWEIASSGVWRFYTGFQKHFGPVHNKMTQRIGAEEDVVMESFIIEITESNVTADFRVHQVIKRFKHEHQLVIVCQNDCHPVEYVNQTTNFGFRETSFIICRPPHDLSSLGEPSAPISIFQMGYWISSYMATTQSGQQSSLRANVTDISQFLFSSLHVEIHTKIDRLEGMLIDEQRRESR